LALPTSTAASASSPPPASGASKPPPRVDRSRQQTLQFFCVRVSRPRDCVNPVNI
jgi:hypothetical protein